LPDYLFIHEFAIFKSMAEPGNILPVLVIGAGPAGLAVAAQLRLRGIGYRIVEKSEDVATSWRNHYDRLHLHSVKKWSSLPHMEFPEVFPRYVSRAQFVKYLEDYTRHFRIKPMFGVEVLKVHKTDDGLWKVETNTNEFYARNVIIATGVNRIPKIPTWEGQEHFEGEIMHSREYRNPEPFLNDRVLVVGMGNTGAEIALDLSEHNIPVFLSVRSPVNIVPRDLYGKPIQESGRLLAKIPFGVGEWIGAGVQRLYFGNLKKYGLRQSGVPPAVELRKTGKTPVIDIGTINAIKKGRIIVVGNIVKFNNNGVTTESGEFLTVNKVVLATGYHTGLSRMVERMEEFYDKNGFPRNPVGTGFHRGLFFVGFDDYKLGGILGTITEDSQIVADELTKRV